MNIDDATPEGLDHVEEIKIPSDPPEYYKIQSIEESAGISYSIHIDPEHPTMTFQSASTRKSYNSIFTAS